MVGTRLCQYRIDIVEGSVEDLRVEDQVLTHDLGLVSAYLELSKIQDMTMHGWRILTARPMRPKSPTASVMIAFVVKRGV